MWGDILAAQRASLRRKAEADGMLSMPTSHALDLMEAALTLSTPVLAAMAVDWKMYHAQAQPHFPICCNGFSTGNADSEARPPRVWLCSEISKLLGTSVGLPL